MWVQSWVEKIPWHDNGQPAPAFFPGKFHGWMSLVGYSPWGCKESNTAEWLITHTWSKEILKTFVNISLFKDIEHYKILESTSMFFSILTYPSPEEVATVIFVFVNLRLPLFFQTVLIFSCMHVRIYCLVLVILNSLWMESLYILFCFHWSLFLKLICAIVCDCRAFIFLMYNMYK